MPYLGTKFTSKHLKSSRDTSPYRFAFKFEGEFANFTHRDPHRENVNLNLRRFASAKQCRHLSRAMGLERAWERKGRRSTSLRS
ncbi:hypothetical protein EII16_11135 [Campylobacter rectus]|nr:hypothetical protein EII16_11135 [Campylobacter rectus]